jgi:hypothetical protein
MTNDFLCPTMLTALTSCYRGMTSRQQLMAPIAAADTLEETLVHGGYPLGLV